MLTDARRALASPLHRWVVVVTALVGVLAAIGLGASSPPEQQTLAALSPPVQSLMSVTVPVFGIVLVANPDRRDRTTGIGGTLVVAAAMAVAVALFGFLVIATALSLFASDVGPSRWQHAGPIVLGSVLVQLVAQAVGTGLGLLLRFRVLAVLASIVLPLGLWLGLGAVTALRDAQGWLTPFALAPIVLSGRMTAHNWVQWLVMVSLWAVGLNAAGVLWSRRRGAGF